MSRRIADVKRRTGKRGLPIGFDAFVHADPPVSIESPSLFHYGLNRAATKVVVPFAKFSDGDLLALWYRDNQTPIIAIPGHAEPRLVAIDFENFLRAVNCRQTGMPDLDSASPRLKIAGYAGRPKRTGFKGLEKDLSQWVANHSSRQPASSDDHAKQCRDVWYAAARRMIGDGVSRFFTLESEWIIDFRVAKTARGMAVTYLEYGKWYRLPSKYEPRALADSLLANVPSNQKAEFEVSVLHTGLFAVDKGRTLLVAT